MIIRLLIYLLLIYFGVKLFRSLLGSGGTGARRVFSPKPGAIDDIMIKDPVCNVYFPKREGIHVKVKDKDLYFCSAECRDKYLKQNKKEPN